MYSIIRAARYLKVAPWKLYKMPSYWLYWAIASEKADILVEEALAKNPPGKKGKR